MEDQNNFGGTTSVGSGHSGHDLEGDIGVKRAKALTASLKNVCVRTQAWIATLKQNGANAAACAQAALEGARDEFGDVSYPFASSFIHGCMYMRMPNCCRTWPKDMSSHSKSDTFAIAGHHLGVVNRMSSQGTASFFVLVNIIIPVTFLLCGPKRVHLFLLVILGHDAIQSGFDDNFSITGAPGG